MSFSLTIEQPPGDPLPPPIVTAKFSSNVEPSQIETALKVVSNNTRTYFDLFDNFSTTFEELDPHSEIFPNPDLVGSKIMQEWDGRITIITSLKLRDVQTLAERILKVSNYCPPADLQGNWKLKYIESRYPKKHTFEIRGSQKGSLELDTRIVLPHNLPTNPQPEQDEVPLNQLSLLSSNPQQMNAEGLELLARQARFNESITTKLMDQLKTEQLGNFAKEFGNSLNQTDWYELFRSAGPASVATGAAAAVLGGPAAWLLEPVAATLGVTGGFATLYDNREELMNQASRCTDIILQALRERYPAGTVIYAEGCQQEGTDFEKVDHQLEEEEGWQKMEYENNSARAASPARDDKSTGEG